MVRGIAAVVPELFGLVENYPGSSRRRRKVKYNMIDFEIGELTTNTASTLSALICMTCPED